MTVGVAIPSPLYNALVRAKFRVGGAFSGEQFDQDKPKSIDVTLLCDAFAFFSFYKI